MSNDVELQESRSTEQIACELIGRLNAFPSVVVAFSGGVDSAVVAAAAFRAVREKAIAVTGIGAATPLIDREIAQRIASEIGIRHIELKTNEIEDDRYVRNDGRRCFFCKSTLYSTLRNWADANGFEAICSGTNTDDLGDYRPGLEAAANHGVIAPLVDCNIDKTTVRKLARLWQLDIADKPASPCLASRIAYGQIVTIGRLDRIQAIESFLRGLGFEDVRVRLHDDSLIRVELKLDQLERACEPSIRQSIVALCKEHGFSFVTLDLAGRESGSLNRLLDRHGSS